MTKNSTRVLLVESDPAETLRIRGLLLEGLGPAVEVIDCAMLCEAVLVMSSERFDVALVDLHTPDALPAEVVTGLIAAAPHVPIVAMSASLDERWGTTVVHQGAEDFIRKEHISAALLARQVRYNSQRGTTRTQYRAILAQLPDPLMVLSERGRVEFANDAASELYGRSARQLLGLRFPLPVTNDAGRAEAWIRHAAGALRRVEIAVVRSSWGGEPATLVSIRDVTRRHEAQAALHAEARKFESLVARLPGLVWTTDTELNMQFFGGGQIEAALADYGLATSSPEETTAHADALDAEDAAERPLAGGSVPGFRNVLDYLDPGSPIRPAYDLALRGESAFYKGQLRGREWEVNIDPLRDDEDLITGVIGFAVDATEKTQMERALAQAQKLEAVGQLAAGVAHELNTPLQYVSDNLQFMTRAIRRIEQAVAVYDAYCDRIEAPGIDLACERTALRQQLGRLKLDWVREQAARALEQSLEGVAQASRIVRAMKESVHHGSGEKALTDLNHLVTQAIEVSRNEWKYVANVEVELEPGLPPVPVVAGEISQVLLNLIINAAHARADLHREDPGCIRISTQTRGGHVELRVEDDGGGIPEHIRQRIFDPFFTTKEVGRGTGQGLAIARRIVVDTHHGSIDAQSRPGEGTTFTVRLPLDEESTLDLPRCA